MIQSLSVTLTSQSQKPATQGKVNLETWDEKERIRRGLKWAGMFFGFACIAVLIPGLHFILVPSFLIASPIVGYKIYKQPQAILGGSGICPDCQKEIALAPSFHPFPLKDVCNLCFCEITLSQNP